MENPVSRRKPVDHESIYSQLSRALDESNSLVLRAVDYEVRDLGLSNAKLRLLFHICVAGNDGASLTSLSESCLRELNTTSILLAKLEKDGLVARIPGKGREKCRFVMTPKGSDVYFNKVTNNALDMFFNILSDEEKVQLLAILKKLVSGGKDMLGISFVPKFLVNNKADVD